MTSTRSTLREATAVKQVTSHSYSAILRDEWCIGSVPHGGYVTSTFLKVAETHFNTTLCGQAQPDTITLHLEFLRRTNIGPALFTVKDIKRGRQTSVIHVTLSQNERVEIVGYITNSNLITESGLSFTTDWKLSPSPKPVSLAFLKSNMDTNWTRQISVPFPDFRKASKMVDFHFPKSGQSAKHMSDSWLRFSDGERFTNLSLGFLADIFPMPVEAFLGNANSSSSTAPSEHRRIASFWYPTLLLNLDVKKKLPDGGVEWLFSRCTTKKIKNGRSDIEIIICDEGGDVVALSHHVALILDAGRNLSERTNVASVDSKM